MARRAPRRRASDISRRQRRSIQQLIVTCLALGLLLLFWAQLSQGAVGCFTMMSGGQGEVMTPSAPRPSGDATGSTPTGAPDPEAEAPAIRVQVPDAAPR